MTMSAMSSTPETETTQIIAIYDTLYVVQILGVRSSYLVLTCDRSRTSANIGLATIGWHIAAPVSYRPRLTRVPSILQCSCSTIASSHVIARLPSSGPVK